MFILLDKKKNTFLKDYLALKNIEASRNVVYLAVNAAIIMITNRTFLMQRFNYQKSPFEFILNYPSRRDIVEYVQNISSVQLNKTSSNTVMSFVTLSM